MPEKEHFHSDNEEFGFDLETQTETEIDEIYEIIKNAIPHPLKPQIIAQEIFLLKQGFPIDSAQKYAPLYATIINFESEDDDDQKTNLEANIIQNSSAKDLADRIKKLKGNLATLSQSTAIENELSNLLENFGIESQSLDQENLPKEPLWEITTHRMANGLEKEDAKNFKEQLNHLFASIFIKLPQNIKEIILAEQTLEVKFGFDTQIYSQHLDDLSSLFNLLGDDDKDDFEDEVNIALRIAEIAKIKAKINDLHREEKNFNRKPNPSSSVSTINFDEAAKEAQEWIDLDKSSDLTDEQKEESQKITLLIAQINQLEDAEKNAVLAEIANSQLNLSANPKGKGKRDPTKDKDLGEIKRVAIATLHSLKVEEAQEISMNLQSGLRETLDFLTQDRDKEREKRVAASALKLANKNQPVKTL